MITHRMGVLLASATVLVALASCTGGGASPEASPTPSATPSPGTAIIARSPSPRPQTGDKARDMVRCLRDKGWDVVVTDDGWETGPSGIPNAQVAQYDADTELCYQELGYSKLLTPSVTEAHAEALYRALLEVADCMRGLGYAVPEAPSQQKFVEDLVNRPVPSWHPYDVVNQNGASEADIRRVETECPVPQDWANR